MNPNCGEFSQQCEILGRESFRNICSSLKSSVCGPEHSKGGEHCNFTSVAATWASPHTNAKGKNSSQQQPRAMEGGRTSGARQRLCLCPEGYVEVTRAASFPPHAMLTYLTISMFTLETKWSLQAWQPVERIRNSLQAPNKSSSLQKTWDSKTEPSAKTFCREGKGQQLRPWTFLD